MGRGRGRGHGRGRGGFQKSFGRRRKHDQDSTSLSRKDVAHFKQFGEKHPSQELGRDFGHTQAPKRGKFDRGGRKANFLNSSANKQASAATTASSSESSEEEETTPYNELLSVFSGRKPNEAVQVVSDEDEESEEEEEIDERDLDEESDEMSSESDVEKSGLKVDGLQRTGAELDSDSEEGEKDILLGERDDEHDDESHTLAEEKEHEDSKENENDDAEEEPEDEVIDEAEIDPELNESESTIDSDRIDPFVQHFDREMAEELQKELKKDAPSSFRTLQMDWPVLERFTFKVIKDIFTEEEDDATTRPQSSILSDLDKMPKIKIPEPPHLPAKPVNLMSLNIKAQLHVTIPLVNQASLDKKACSQPLTSLQAELIDLASRYHDIYFPMRDIDTAEEIRLAYCIHAANHVLKTRTRILHHNAKMANKTDVPEAYRDQGFVRPKVLILAPFKNSALLIVKTLLGLILKEEKGNVANRKRFQDEYGGETLFMPKTNPKPEDYMKTFEGNVEDNFKIGMAITKKSVKLYTGFYSSDIIVASPLGLRMIIGAEGEKSRDYDFLSSIEVLIMDQADVFLMQNWDHVLHIMRHLHLQPVTTHGTDFARIRPWALDGLCKYYCQTLVFSSLACPEHSSLMTKYCKNYAGQARIVPTSFKGSICHVTVQLPQVFQNFDVGSIGEVDDKRFEYFTKHVLPNFKEKLMSHTLIFVSSYFDFVKIRNYFKREEVSFVQICEYTKDKKIARSRDLFFHGANHFLLYTERSHFFRRFRLKGIGHVIFYQLPQNPQFYPELCNFVQENFQNRRVRQRKNSSVNVIYCKYDAPRLAAIVGTERASRMLNSDKKIHAFVSGEL